MVGCGVGEVGWEVGEVGCGRGGVGGEKSGMWEVVVGNGMLKLPYKCT